jgi:hypothetical protein
MLWLRKGRIDIGFSETVASWFGLSARGSTAGADGLSGMVVVFGS